MENPLFPFSSPLPILYVCKEQQALYLASVIYASFILATSDGLLPSLHLVVHGSG